MRKLVDLNSRLAVIVWFEKAYFPLDKESRFRELHHTKLSGGRMTEDEQNEYEALKNTEGDIKPQIGSIHFATLVRETHDTPFVLAGGELAEINRIIDELNKSYEGRKTTIWEYESSRY